MFDDYVISIHALTRSATNKEKTVTGGVLFQSTHSQGVRHFIAGRAVMSYEFQSTHSQGVRPYDNLIIALRRDISIHALTRSAT